MLHRIVALLLLLTTCPVTAELVDCSVHHHHQPRLGLDVNDADHDGHHDGDADDERDCTPWCHNCRCHPRTTALIAAVATADPILVLPSTTPLAAASADGREPDQPVLPPPIV
jgi:hypothetical protein